MSYTVWTKDLRNLDDSSDYIVLTDIPTFSMADRLLRNLEEIYGDSFAWIEED